MASSAENGSSISTTGRSSSSVRASAARCRWPPDSVAGSWSCWATRPTRASRSVALARSTLAAQPGAERDVALDRKPRQQIVALAHPGEASGERPAVGADDLAPVQPREARDHAQQAALADPARAEQAGPAPGRQDEVEILEQKRAAVAQSRMADDDVEVDLGAPPPGALSLRRVSRLRSKARWSRRHAFLALGRSKARGDAAASCADDTLTPKSAASPSAVEIAGRPRCRSTTMRQASLGLGASPPAISPRIATVGPCSSLLVGSGSKGRPKQDLSARCGLPLVRG